MSSVAILNLGGQEVLGIVPIRKAITMIHRGVARVHTAVGNEKFGPYLIPKAVELVKYIFAKWKYDRGTPRYSKRGVLERDEYSCGYCGADATTVDHIVPRCSGGLSDWLNTVAACRSCNEKKGGRTPEKAGMKLMVKTYVP
jgi:hypothetical protein